ncbi:hypothetical protein S2091_2338 [Solimicrobium silvestre]|uniref:Uncharacterized protein n=1 Tax=Solimicrobium silvestre TaxID=2099400 RepID=A0A2S9GYY1_9BURK|nr:hypothetical protein S2091_2338 [Solimicrobium silvestre]
MTNEANRAQSAQTSRPIDVQFNKNLIGQNLGKTVRDYAT